MLCPDSAPSWCLSEIARVVLVEVNAMVVPCAARLFSRRPHNMGTIKIVRAEDIAGHPSFHSHPDACGACRSAHALQCSCRLHAPKQQHDSQAWSRTPLAVGMHLAALLKPGGHGASCGLRCFLASTSSLDTPPELPELRCRRRCAGTCGL